MQWHGGIITQLIDHAPVIDFLKTLLNEDIVFMTYAYAISEPGHPGISLHTDGQPYGSKIFGYEGSCPIIIRVLYYLDDLTPEVSPFRVVPRSHLSLHTDANPYKRYAAHPEEVMVTAKAGSALLLNHRVFHGNFPNVGSYARRMLAIAYRPAWAGPTVAQVAAWNEADLAQLPNNIRPYFMDRNLRGWDFDAVDKPANMASEAPGISPSRWQL
jgi:ectoine hydroxylase-related dioxygenase (phytanoyl-CoA dioxygenase family)